MTDQNIPAKEPVMDGWNAITSAFESIYPGQTQPIHFGVTIPWQLGGDDPLDGISVYDGGSYYHFVTYGFSELYAKESQDPEYSGMGFELTVKLKKSGLKDQEAELRNMCGILQSLAEISFDQEECFNPYEYIYTGQDSGIDADAESPITGFITLPDQAGTIDTPNGKVTFVLLTGVTNKELAPVVDGHWSVKDLAEKLGSDVTNFGRESIL